MSKQTSIQWYAEKDTEITIKYLEGKINQIQLAIEKTKCLEQAKQMNKQEVISAFNDGMVNSEDWYSDGLTKEAETYYNETYGGNNE